VVVHPELTGSLIDALPSSGGLETPKGWILVSGCLGSGQKRTRSSKEVLEGGVLAEGAAAIRPTLQPPHSLSHGKWRGGHRMAGDPRSPWYWMTSTSVSPSESAKNSSVGCSRSSHMASGSAATGSSLMSNSLRTECQRSIAVVPVSLLARLASDRPTIDA
jgi:hypothetical protein